ncbi:hypothetical protein [Nitrospira sp. KM1]|uniref:hypothetical protein n=1 Tax=Nitrospira sp. KM1 TaxID=1936990 RepID=UPI001566BBC8|nr:hypothetical protein [Nitrospira sp. KM1]
MTDPATYGIALAVISFAGLFYRFYQLASGSLYTRLKSSYGFRQTSGTFGLVAVIINLPILFFALYVLLCAVTIDSTVDRELVSFIMTLWGIGYIAMEFLLLPFTVCHRKQVTLKPLRRSGEGRKVPGRKHRWTTNPTNFPLRKSA